MSKPMDRKVVMGFVDEARAYLPRIQAALEKLDPKDDLASALEEPHRFVHTIKGASSMVGFPTLSHMAYFMEEAMEEIAGGELKLDDALRRIITMTLERIGQYLDKIEAEDDHVEPLVRDVTKAFRRLRHLPESGDEDVIKSLLAQPAEPSLSTARPSQHFQELDSDEDVPLPPGYEEPELDDAASAELLAVFKMEAEEHLQTMARTVTALSENPNEPNALQDLRRAVHTIKGSAGMVQLRTVSRLAHRLEDLLDRMFDGTVTPTPEILALVTDTGDALEDLTMRDEDSEELAERVRALYTRFNKMLGDTLDLEAFEALNQTDKRQTVIDLSRYAEAEQKRVDAVREGNTSAQSAQSGKTAPSEFVRVPLDRLDALIRLVGELVITRSTFEQHYRRLAGEVDETRVTIERMRRVTNQLETRFEATTLGAGAGTGSTNSNLPFHSAFQSEFDDLELDRYTEFHLLTRELAETASDMQSVGTELRDVLRDFDGYLLTNTRLSGDIQDKLMQLRMIPLATIETRLHRTVRVTAGRQEKQAKLEILGGNVELDKTVLEEMADPLLHMLRNAVDHGIEPPALRQVLNKPAQGTIQVQAFYSGTQVVIRIADDGGGIEPELLRDRVVETGLMAEAEAQHLSDDELYNLIFLPGFSTASEVDEVSGRGVGMDVVRDTVNRLKGTISVQSKPGQGSTFTIRLPLTLAVTRVMLVQSHGQTLAIPLNGVLKILRLDSEETAAIGKQPMLEVDGEYCPVAMLGQALNLPGEADPTVTRRPVLICDVGDQRIALVVDHLVEAREVVVKNLGNHLRNVPGIAGATIMGDGAVVLILNINDLYADDTKQPRRLPVQSVPTSRRNAGKEPRKKHGKLHLLIVDDSLSVRRVLTNFAQSNGWEADTAKDGLDALEYLEATAQLPSVVVLDIEMPRMDGYELTTIIRSHERFRELPIVMLTSRAAEKHRRKAFEVGVSDYLVKPFKENTLRETILRISERELP